MRRNEWQGIENLSIMKRFKYILGLNGVLSIYVNYFHSPYFNEKTFPSLIFNI